MAEEATEQTAPEEEQEPATTEATTEKAYTQEDVDNIVNKVRSSFEKKLTDTTKQLEGLKKKSMSEQEKAIAEAEERGAEKVRAELESFKRQATIERLLAQKGIEKTDKIARLIDPDVDPEDGVAQLEKDMPQLFGDKRPPGGGGGRNPDLDETPDYSDPEVLSRKLQTLKTHEEKQAFWEEHGAEIQRAQRAKVGGVHSIAPGEGMRNMTPMQEAVRRKR